MRRLRAFLGRHSLIALDTSVFIYFLEPSTQYLPLVEPVFSWLERPGSVAVTSTVTMTELLVQPYRDPDERHAKMFYGLLSTYPSLNWIAPDLEIAAMAARLRAHHRLETPDALQAATAVHSGATGMITNNVAFTRVATFETLLLNGLL